MAYVDGFVVAVPAASKQRYIDHAAAAMPLFREFGVTRMVECWEDDVRDGTVTDFRRAVRIEPGEAVVFSWLEWPSREVRDAGMQEMMTDPRMEALGPLPFDGRRMVFGGFTPVFDG